MSQPPHPQRAVAIIERIDDIRRAAKRADKLMGLEIVIGPASPIVRALQATIRKYSDYERVRRAAL